MQYSNIFSNRLLQLTLQDFFETISHELEQLRLEFLGEAGKSIQDMEYYNLIRYYYVSTVSFKGMDIEQG